MPAQTQAFGLEKKSNLHPHLHSTPERHETVAIPAVLMLSIMGHGLVATALAFVPHDTSVPEPSSIEFEVSMVMPAEPPAPPEVIEATESPMIAPVEPEPTRTPRERIARVSAPSVAAPPPEPSSAAPIAPLAPAAIDDVFGAPALLHANTAGASEIGRAGGGGSGGVGVGASRAGTGGVGSGAGGDVHGPTGPSDDEIRRALRAYANRIRDLLDGAAHYPSMAQRSGMQGRVVVGLRIAEDGRLIAARVTSSCGFSMLDEAALAAANDLSRFPAPPTLVTWNTSNELRVPIVFELSR